ncbi:MAG: hypothetical protein P8X95_23345 [Anaerolineales bacterium]
MNEAPSQQTPALLLRINIPSYTGEPFELGPGKNRYLSYFENERGEDWVFGLDSQKRAFITGLEIDWEIIYIPSGSTPSPGIILNNSEQLWLKACWAATTHIRQKAS